MGFRGNSSTIRPGRHRGGFTFIEAMSAAVMLAVITLGVTMAITAASAQSDYALHAQRGGELANELMERAAATTYANIVTTFNNYKEQPNHIANLAGALYPTEYQVFTRSVTAVAGNQTVAGLGTIAGVTVTVTVTDGRSDTWTTTRFIPQPAP